jgi:hypothetical protein
MAKRRSSSTCACRMNSRALPRASALTGFISAMGECAPAPLRGRADRICHPSARSAAPDGWNRRSRSAAQPSLRGLLDVLGFLAAPNGPVALAGGVGDDRTRLNGGHGVNLPAAMATDTHRRSVGGRITLQPALPYAFCSAGAEPVGRVTCRCQLPMAARASPLRGHRLPAWLASCPGDQSDAGGRTSTH